MTEISRGRVKANGLEFEYLEAGTGPLALLWHGFPDSPYTYRYLIPRLVEAGYHVVAPFSRGYAPTELPALRSSIHVSVLVSDQIALATAMGGDKNAILIAHDWGAATAWGSLRQAPHLWGKAVIINAPPLELFSQNLGKFSQIKKSFYFFFFQMHRMIEDHIRANDFEFIADIWREWSPGYDPTEDMVYVRQTLSDPEHLHAALGYYWGQFDPNRFGTPEWADQQAAAWGGSHQQPTLYLHGTTDGCHGMSPEQMRRVPEFCGPGSEASLIEGVGHFMLVEKPDVVNDRILNWLKGGRGR